LIGVITGSGLYEIKDLEVKEEKSLNTPFGIADVIIGTIEGKDIAFIARHGKKHELLPNMVNCRANIFALKELDARAIISTSVMGIVDSSVGLAKVLLFDDIYFPENRLPDGNICTLFTQPAQPDRAHYIFASPFSSQMREVAAKVADGLNVDYLNGGVYGHVNGPRFNSKAEIKQLQAAGVTAISQTCGPEAVLAGELGIPYLLIGFGIDYANGVSPEPTPIEVLDSNLNLAASVMPELIKGIVASTDPDGVSFEGYLYRFE